jgi:hypothetical protein
MVAKLTASNSPKAARPGPLPHRRNRTANGNKKSDASAGGNRPEDDLGPLSVAAVAAGTSNDSDTSLNVASAGNDHEVFVSCVHPEELRVAVAPVGSPVTVRVLIVGNAVPLVGVISIV